MNAAKPWSTAAILSTVQRYWGYGELRPLQEQAIRAGLEQRDSVVVLPTGGGKSLCYQVPAALAERTDIVISPLISLMKDQVDGLRECGYPAAALYGGMAAEEVRAIRKRPHRGPVSVVVCRAGTFADAAFHWKLIEHLNIRAFAIDEAHCISHWGHDFRPEYRRLAELEEPFPASQRARIHGDGDGASAQRHRAAIELHDPAVLVGTFDRPNLVYRIVPRVDALRQTLEILRRHAIEAAIVYCISRKDTESMAAFLEANELRAAHYHAGMEADDRRRTQDALPRKRSTSSPPRLPSAWASTAAMCVVLYTQPCRNPSSTISKKPAAPGATVWKPNACCFIPLPT